MAQQAVVDSFVSGADEQASPVKRDQKRRRGPPRSAILMVIAVIGLLHAYVGFRLFPALDLSIKEMLASVLLLALSTVLIPLALLAPMLSRKMPKWLESSLVWCGLITGGFASSLLVLTVLRDIALLPSTLFLADAKQSAIENYSAWAALGLAGAFSFVGLINARRAPRIVNVDVPLANLPPALQGFRIAQISDIHVGPTIKRAFLQRIVDQVNQLEADVVAITGDLVDGSVTELATHTDALKDLRAKHGSYFVTGNHEYYSGADAWISELRRLGVSVLQNEHVCIEHGGEQIILAGVSDYSGHHFGEHHRSNPHAAMAGAPDAGAKILLAHQPRSAPEAELAGFDLQLSGHTHGGQFFPWNFFVPLQQPYTAGLHQLKKMWVYTSRGTGYWGPPKRLGAPAEITLLRLVSA